MSAEHGAEHGASEECVVFIERIVALIDNELDQLEIEEVRIHLDGCGPCLESYDIQRMVKLVVGRSCSEIAPHALRARVMQTITELRGPER
jgi:mycothiol system anti-sigma-R factor